jgi:uncharacterized membrane protein YcaP (DUF421 family)
MDMWHPSLNWWEFIARGAIVYIFVLVILRVTGKRQVGQLAPFDLVLLLVLSNAVQNAMNGGDNSITGGVISACTLVGLNYVVGFLTYKSKALEGWIEGHPVVLIHNGQVNHKAMRTVQMTLHELCAALRAGGCAGPHECRMAVLETCVDVTVSPRNHEHNHVANGGHGAAMSAAVGDHGTTPNPPAAPSV